jgi:flagellar basal-body rod modification protein FlgD
VSGIQGTSTSSSGDIRGNYMTLLVTQLQNQNPLEPMSSDEMTSQLTQLSQLEHMESLDSTFAKTLFAAQVNQGSELIDKEVTFMPDEGNEAVTGRVGGVDMIDGKVMLSVGGSGVEIDRILSIAK